MPYIVTTKQTRFEWPSATVEDRRQKNTQLRQGYVSRRAVATLDEARYLIEDALDHDNVVHPPAIAEGWRQLDKVDESGGTVGPLPDGTVIEVERVEWEELEDELPKSEAAIIDAYNAAQT